MRYGTDTSLVHIASGLATFRFDSASEIKSETSGSHAVDPSLF
jgi:hypothetical protein